MTAHLGQFSSAQTLRGGDTLPSAVTRCFHCGQDNAGGVFVADGKSFCCLGCQTVHALLTENGLGQFYELSSTPGTTARGAAKRDHWAYLDDPLVQEKLLDFADVKTAKVTLHLPQIHCVACVWLLENLFRLHPGIGRSTVHFSRHDVSLTFSRAEISLSGVVALIASIGYEPTLTLGELDAPKGASPHQRRHLQLGLAGFGFGNIMLLSIPGYLGLDSFSGPFFKMVFGWLSLALALPVLVYSAADFWRNAWLSLRQRIATLDVPIALGLAAIYGQSAFDILTHRGEGYLDSLTGLIFFLLCGRLFQQKTHDRLAFDRDYKGFFPLSVVRRTSAGEESVAISRLEVGDRLILRGGELLPADANLVAGTACLDYSFVTGESEPVTCAVGTHLYAGGRQTGGAIEVETIKPVSQSYLTSLWNNEIFRKDGGVSLDTITNRYSRRFTWIVLGVALGAAAFWLRTNPAIAAKAFVSVLIVACPCALALAAPLTLGTAQRVFGRAHIFLKNALVLERLAEVDTIVLDKTGTLTGNDASGVSFRGAPLNATETNRVLSLTRHSVHPHSLRITRALALEAAALPVTDFVETPGCGLTGVIEGTSIRLGSLTWLKDCGIKIPAEVTATGNSACLAIDGHFRGCFSLTSPLRPEVAALVRRLGDRYLLALLSGDNAREEERFRALLGETATLRFDQSPLDKLNFVRDLQRTGRKVMMVGDGLNDAGALKQSDVGVAVVERVGAFSPASDVILDAAQLPQLARILDFSRRAVRVIRAGFLLSGLYNLVGIGIAAAGLLSPIVCAVLMPLSSISVVLFACGATRWAARRAGLTDATPTPGAP